MIICRVCSGTPFGTLFGFGTQGNFEVEESFHCGSRKEREEGKETTFQFSKPEVKEPSLGKKEEEAMHHVLVVYHLVRNPCQLCGGR